MFLQYHRYVSRAHRRQDVQSDHALFIYIMRRKRGHLQGEEVLMTLMTLRIDIYITTPNRWKITR